MKWETKIVTKRYRQGADVVSIWQASLDVLSEEGWEIVSATALPLSYPMLGTSAGTADTPSEHRIQNFGEVLFVFKHPLQGTDAT